jgi:O-antigen/teichoic acid export membrane protein
MYKKLLSDSAIYGLGAIAIKSLAFFILPIYTRIFSPSEYGVIEMFSTIAGILSILMTMGLDSAQSFYFMEAKNKKIYDTNIIITSILQLRITLGVFVIGMVAIFTPYILNFAFDTHQPSKLLLIVAFSVFFANLVSQSLEVFRLLYKPWQYIGLSFLQTILAIGLILYFSYVKKMGIEGYLVGNMLGMFMAMLIGWFATKKYRYWSTIEISLWKNFLKFGLPLVPAGFTIWVMQASDRWFVMNMLGSYEVGIYSIGAKFAMLLALGIEVFRKAWWPLAMDILHKPEGSRFIRDIARWYILLGSIGAVTLALIAPYLVRIMVDEQYFESWRIVGILGWSGIFYGFYLISELGIFKSKKTYYSFYINLFGALINIGLNYFLILKLGMIGAAYATVVALMISNILAMKVSNRFFPVKWQWSLYGLTIGVSMITIFYLELE